MSNAILTQFGIWPDAFRVFWFELLFGSTLILLAAGVICLCLSRATAALRCRVWALAMLGLLCFPMISLCVPRMSPTFLGGNFADVNHASLQESEFDTLPDVTTTTITPEIITDIDASAASMELTPVDHAILSRQTQLNAENAATPSELPVIAMPIETEGMAALPEPPHALDADASSAELPPLADENMLFVSEPLQEQATSEKSTALWPTLILVWFGGMALACMMLLRSWLVSRYVFRAAALPDNPAWQREVDAISEKIGLRRTVIALICPSTSVPFVAGFGQTAVFLPPQCDTWDAAQRQAVLVHELTHVLRRDIVLQLITRIAGMLYWFQPLFWIAAKQIRIEREMACDDAVLVYGERPSRYASVLLSVASTLKSRRGSALGLSISMARRSRVERRIRSILRTGRNRMPVGRKSALLLMLGIGVIVTGAAMFSPFEPPKFFAAAQAAVEEDADENTTENDMTDNADDEKPEKADETSAQKETAELRKILENQLQASRDEVAACEEAYKEGRVDAKQYRDAKKRSLEIELQLLELFPDSLIEDYSNRVPSSPQMQTALAIPVSHEEINAKIKAAENRKLAAKEKLKFVFEMYKIGEKSGTVANMADACYDFIDVQIQLCDFWLDDISEESQKTPLLQYRKELYVKARDVLYENLQAWEALFEVGRATHAETAAAQQRVSDLELKMLELFPGMEFEKPDPMILAPDRIEALLESDIPTVEINMPPQPVRTFEWQVPVRNVSYKDDTAAATKQMVDEIFDIMQNDGNAMKRYETYCSYSAKTLDDTNKDSTGNEINARNRLAWYDAMYRKPLHSAIETEEYSQAMMKAATDESMGVHALAQRASEKMDIPLKLVRRFRPSTFEDFCRQLEWARESYDGMIAPLTPGERQVLHRELYQALCENETRGHTFGNNSKAAQMLTLMNKKDQGEFCETIELLTLLADKKLLDKLTQLPEDIPGAKHETFGENDMQVIETKAGKVLIGGREANVYDLDKPEYASVIALIDLGGNDTYIEGTCDLDRPVLVIIDLEGDDTYTGTKPGIQGASLLGISMLIDCAGNDTYSAKDVAQGSSIGGLGLLIDFGGNDTYHALRRAQGQAFSGVGMLIDRAGNDSYHAAMWSQGFGHTAGFGLLADLDGKDRYYLGGKYLDSYPEHPGYEGWGQGVGSGFRGSNGSACGGIGMLLDGGDGDDLYEFDYMAHGVGYWMGIGIARDFGGNDRRIASTQLDYDGNKRAERAWQRHGCGSAVHYALGFVFDDNGDDVYEGHIMGQGMGWDLSTAFLCDFAGNDRYLAQGGHRNAMLQGVGAESSIGVLFDYQGDDVYDGKSQGFADTKSTYHATSQSGGNFGFLVDLGGKDQYGTDAANDRVTKRGDGFVIDR